MVIMAELQVAAMSKGFQKENQSYVSQIPCESHVCELNSSQCDVSNIFSPQ